MSLITRILPPDAKNAKLTFQEMDNNLYYLQSIGVKFGQHLNAYTSFDETVYFLPIPSDNPEKLEKFIENQDDFIFEDIE